MKYQWRYPLLALISHFVIVYIVNLMLGAFGKQSDPTGRWATLGLALLILVTLRDVTFMGRSGEMAARFAFANLRDTSVLVIGLHSASATLHAAKSISEKNNLIGLIGAFLAVLIGTLIIHLGGSSELRRNLLHRRPAGE